MPYPIGTLPYPFRSRLRQLLSPAELYQLQVATGSLEDNKDFLPLQTYCSTSTLSFERLNLPTPELIWVKPTERIKHNGKQLLNGKNLYLVNLIESDLPAMFHYVLLADISWLFIVDCTVTDQFLSKLTRKGVKPTSLMVESCSALSPSVTKFSELFKTFPTLQKCYFRNYLISGWVKKLADYGNTNLKEFSIMNNQFTMLFDYKPINLYRFVKAQKDGFKLRLFYIGDQEIAHIEAKVLPMFTLYFKPSDFKSCSVEVMIQCLDKFSHHFYVQRY